MCCGWRRRLRGRGLLGGMGEAGRDGWVGRGLRGKEGRLSFFFFLLVELVVKVGVEMVGRSIEGLGGLAPGLR